MLWPLPMLLVLRCDIALQGDSAYPIQLESVAAALLGATQKVGSVQRVLHLLALLLVCEAGCHVTLAVADTAGLEVW